MVARGSAETYGETALAGGPMYQAGRRLAQAVLFLLARVRLEGAENIPAGGPLLVIANHVSIVDPVLIAGVFPRPLTFLAKRELFQVAPLAWCLRAAGVISIDRAGADRRALEATLGALRRGAAVLVFAEGTRSRDGVVGRAKAGAALLAVRSGAPVLPMAVDGTERLRRMREWTDRPQLVLRCGPLLPPASRPGSGGYQALADDYMSRVAALLPPERRGEYAHADGSPSTPASAAARVGSAS